MLTQSVLLLLLLLAYIPSTFLAHKWADYDYLAGRRRALNDRDGRAAGDGACRRR